MAITFLEKRKRLKFLIGVLLIIVLITLIIIWQGFFAKKKVVPLPPPKISRPVEKIKIDFEALKNPQIEELQPFEKIPSFEGKIGRENPFLPY